YDRPGSDICPGYSTEAFSADVSDAWRWTDPPILDEQRGLGPARERAQLRAKRSKHRETEVGEGPQTIHLFGEGEHSGQPDQSFRSLDHESERSDGWLRLFG